MLQSLEQGRTLSVLGTAVQMKAKGMEPDLDTYNIMLEALANDSREMEVWAVFEDMLAMGITPDVRSFKWLVWVHQHFLPQKHCSSYRAMSHLLGSTI